MIFSPNMTADPSLNGRSLAATEGFDYASFLVGSPNNGYIAASDVPAVWGQVVRVVRARQLEGDAQTDHRLWVCVTTLKRT